MSAQAEVRARFGNSAFGYVAFAGVGSVGATRTCQSGLQSAVGLGLRYRLSVAFPVGFCIGSIRNRDGE
jgi:hypothetical protein